MERRMRTRQNYFFSTTWILTLLLLIVNFAAAQDSTFVDPVKTDTVRETPSSVPAGNTQLDAPRNYNSLIKNSELT